MIDVFYTKVEQQITDIEYKKFLYRIPEALQEKNLRYTRWQDRYANLFGKILLLDGLEKIGFNDTVLNKLNFDEYGRPFLQGDIDFNISHSEEVVVCAIGAEVRLGIDIEKISTIDFEDFRDVMTDEEWKTINDSSLPVNKFFDFWCMKESVIKANGRGLEVPLKEILIRHKTANYHQEKWYLHSLTLEKAYCCFLATSVKDPVVKVHYREYIST